MIQFLIDAAMYLVLAGASFAAVVWLWRRIFGTVQTRLERFLFWGTWAGLSILLAGTYHVATGERDFGRLLMLLALAVAIVVTVGVNIAAAVMFRKPYVPEEDPEFMAYIDERRAATRRRLAEIDRGRLP